MSEQEREQRLETLRNLIADRRGWRLGLGLAARSTAMMAGCCSMMMGVLLTFTLCGAVIGVPLFAFGFLLVARALF